MPVYTAVSYPKLTSFGLIIIAEAVKDSQKTVIPGVSESRTKRLTGIFACMADNSKIRAFMKRVNERKKYNDPDNQETSQGKIYSKMELDIANVDPFLKNKLIKKNFGFVEQYMDTSALSGEAYLPRSSDAVPRLRSRR